MKVWLTRDRISYYCIHFKKPKWIEYYKTYSSGFYAIIPHSQSKKLFNLKRHLRPGSRKILEFEVNVKEVK